jgi:hypothetical protein
MSNNCVISERYLEVRYIVLGHSTNVLNYVGDGLIPETIPGYQGQRTPRLEGRCDPLMKVTDSRHGPKRYLDLRNRLDVHNCWGHVARERSAYVNSHNYGRYPELQNGQISIWISTADERWFGSRGVVYSGLQWLNVFGACRSRT